MTVKLLVLMVHINEEVAEGDEFDLVHECIDQAVADIGLAGVWINIYTVTDEPPKTGLIPMTEMGRDVGLDATEESWDNGGRP